MRAVSECVRAVRECVRAVRECVRAVRECVRAVRECVRACAFRVLVRMCVAISNNCARKNVSTLHLLERRFNTQAC